MASRKSIWDGMDRLEGKKEGSSHAALNKERVRQGYKPEGAKTKALKKRTGKMEHFDAYYKSGKGDLSVIKKHFGEYKKYSQDRANKNK